MQSTSRRLRGRQLYLLLFLFLLLIAGAAQAKPPENPDPDDPSGGLPRTPPAYQPPAGGFNWKAPRRYDQWTYAWRERDESGSWETETYRPSYVNPEAWFLEVMGCESESEFLFDFNPDDYPYDGSGPGTRYRWTWAGKSSTDSSDCYRTLAFPEEGIYEVVLRITHADGSVVNYRQIVQIKDYLIVVIGDSAAAGEGAPDAPINGVFDLRNADWADDRCHRSTWSGGAQAAKMIEDASDKTSVTFLTFACSGATLDTVSWGDTSLEDPYEVAEDSKWRGTGITGPYVGIEPLTDSNGFYSDLKHVPAQTEALWDALTENGTRPARRIDALIVTGGINDAGFAKLAAICVLFHGCPDESVGWHITEIPLDDQYAEDVANIVPGYQKLWRQLFGWEDPAFNVPADQTLVLEYPPFFTDDDGSRCVQLFQDVIPEWLQLQLGLTFGIFGPFLWDYLEIEHAANVWAPMLNKAVKDGAKAGDDLYGGIAFVDGIADGFYRHGMCADDRYINTPSDAAYAQGDDGGESWLLASLSSTGLAHPNRNGYLVYAQEILERIDHLLFNEPPVGNGELLWTTPGVTLKHMLLDNDFDPDPDDQLYARLATPPKHGSATVDANGKLTYVPQSGFSGGDSLFYEVSDGEYARLVKVNIIVEAPVVLEPFVLGGTVTAIDGLLGHNELTGPYRVEIDRQPKLGLARPASGEIPPRIWYEAPIVNSPTKVEIGYTVWSETLDRDSPSFEAAVRGIITVTIQPPAKKR